MSLVRSSSPTAASTGGVPLVTVDAAPLFWTGVRIGLLVGVFLVACSMAVTP